MVLAHPGRSRSNIIHVQTYWSPIRAEHSKRESNHLVPKGFIDLSQDQEPRKVGYVEIAVTGICFCCGPSLREQANLTMDASYSPNGLFSCPHLVDRSSAWKFGMTW